MKEKEKNWFDVCHLLLARRVSLVVELEGGHKVFWEMVFGSFMVSEPNLS